MRRKGDVGPAAPRRVGVAERVAAAETVARDGQLGEVVRAAHVVNRLVDDGLRLGGGVHGQPGFAVKGRVVEVGRRRGAVEEVWHDGCEACAGKGVG